MMPTKQPMPCLKKGEKMNNSGSDFSTVKVGDRLWLRDNLYEGWVTVKAVYPTNFRVFVNSYEALVSKDGKWADDGASNYLLLQGRDSTSSETEEDDKEDGDGEAVLDIIT